MEPEKTTCQTSVNDSPKKFENLSYIKCLFFTNKQFNEEAESYHKPRESFYKEKIIDGSNKQKIENEINQMIREIHTQLNNGNPARDYKIPAPIFVMMGRVLKESGSIFGLEPVIRNEYITTFVEKDGKQVKKVIKGKPIYTSIISYITDYLSSAFSTDEDKKNYESSVLNTYTFNGNVKIFIYIPYMTNKYKYITNFTDLINSATFISSIINNDYYLGFDPTTMFDEEKINKLKIQQPTKDLLINMFNYRDKVKYRFYDDLVNLCYDGGCISDSGEDFKRLLPDFANDDSKDEENAKKMSPYMPSKCLSKTNNFICNIKDVKDNLLFEDFIKINAKEEISLSIQNYEKILKKINENEQTTEAENDLITKYNKSPINILIEIVNKYILNGYSNDLDEKTKEIKQTIINDDGEVETKKKKINANHYSKDYSTDIIKELAFINNKYPSVPEIVTTMYLYKEETLSNIITYMPFGLKIPNNYNTLHFDYEQLIDEKVYSIDKKFALVVDKNGLIYVFNVPTNQVYYFLNRDFVQNVLSMNISEAGISVNYIDDNKNKKNKVVLKIEMIDKTNPKTLPPYTCILNEKGELVVYGNAFLNSTSTSLSNLIQNEIDFVKSLTSPIDINSLNKLDKNRIKKNGKLEDLNILNVNEPYVYRSNK